MKRNIFLRAALCLFIGVWASGTMLTGAWAKYVATGLGTASARIAEFSVQVGSRKYDSANKNWKAASDASFWDEIVTLDGINPSNVQTFELPLFDYEYSSLPSRDVNAGVIGGTSVSSSGAYLVVAPGTGHGGAPKHNPNLAWDLPGPPATNSKGIFSIQNKSEVTIRFKLEYDPENSLLPAVNASTGAVTVEKPVAGKLFLPITIRAGGNTGSLRTDLWTADDGPNNLYLSNDKTAALGSGFTLVDGDAWRTLAPTQSIELSITWLWGFADVAQSAFVDTSVTPNLSFSGGWSYGAWADLVAAPGGYTNWQGLSSTTLLPELGTTRAGNIDRFDTLLGLAAGKGQDLNVSLAFRITIEQVD